MNKARQAKSKPETAVAESGPWPAFNNLRAIVIMGVVVLVGLFLATGFWGWGVSFGQEADEVPTTYSYSVAGGELTVTLAEAGVTGWKVIAIDDKAGCDTAQEADFTGSGVALDSDTPAQSATITFVADTNYCFWPLRPTDNVRIRYSYVPARFIQQINPSNLEDIDQTSYNFSVAADQLTVTLNQGGAKGWQVIKVAGEEACTHSGFATATKIIDSSDAVDSISLTYEADTNYCFWPTRDTDYIKIVLFHVAAEDIAKLASSGQEVQTPPINNPDTPVTPPDSTNQPTALVITGISQTVKDSDAILRTITSRAVTDGAAVRLDRLSVSGCDNAAFGDDSLLHSNARVEDGAFYIVVTPEDHGKEFCFQVTADEAVAYKVSEAVDLPPVENGTEQPGNEDETENNKDETGNEDETDEDESEENEDENNEEGSVVGVAGTEDETDEDDDKTMFFIIILAAIGVGIMAVFAIIIGISNTSRSKPKF